MTPEEKIRELMMGIGSIAEVCGVMFKELLRNGFTREEAVQLTEVFLTSVIMTSGSGKDED